MTTYVNLKFIDEPVYYHGFPWRKISYDDITKDFIKLKNKLNNSNINFPLKSSYIGYNCTDKFFQYERLNTPSDTNMSCVEKIKGIRYSLVFLKLLTKCKKALISICLLGLF